MRVHPKLKASPTRFHRLYPFKRTDQAERGVREVDRHTKASALKGALLLGGELREVERDVVTREG
jgi:hypothetical protein